MYSLCLLLMFSNIQFSPTLQVCLQVFTNKLPYWCWLTPMLQIYSNYSLHPSTHPQYMFFGIKPSVSKFFRSLLYVHVWVAKFCSSFVVHNLVEGPQPQPTQLNNEGSKLQLRPCTLQGPIGHLIYCFKNFTPSLKSPKLLFAIRFQKNVCYATKRATSPWRPNWPSFSHPAQ